MRRIFPILLLSGILMFTACEGDNRGNNNSDDYEAVSAVSAEAPEASTENEETSEPPAVSEEPSEEESSETVYTLPVVDVPEEPEYDLSEYSPVGTPGAKKIIIRVSDVGDTIPADMFAKNNEITDVYIDDGIKVIGGGSFWKCESLESVRLPSTLVEFGGQGFNFYGCGSLKAIYIPEGVKSLNFGTFAFCGLETVSLPDGFECISSEAFYGCFSLTGITLPQSLKYIEKKGLPYAHGDNPGIHVIEYPDNLEEVWYPDCEAVFVNKNSKTYETLERCGILDMHTLKIIIKDDPTESVVSDTFD